MNMDLHTHSIASGHGTTDKVSDMIDEARKKGMRVIGFAEHGPGTLGGGTLSYFMGLKLLPRKKDSLMIRYGVELNIMDASGRLDLPDYVLKELDFAYASIHPQNIRKLSGDEALRAYVGAMQNPYVKFIGHPDDERYPLDYDVFVNKCLEFETIPELNEVSVSPASYRPGSFENAKLLLKSCLTYNCPIIIGSDSHGKAGIGEAPFALELLKEMEFPNNLVFNHAFE